MSGNALFIPPEQFFRELLQDAQKNQGTSLDQDTEFYLVNLLTAFIDTDRLYAVDSDGKNIDEPLAVMLLKAQELESTQEKGLTFRRIGDISLYVSGFFSNSFARKIIDVDYYINMGATCYRTAKNYVQKSPYPEVFENLSSRFPKYVDLFNEIADRTVPKGSNSSLLRLYELWTKTGSERLAKLLKEQGIMPTDAIKNGNGKQ